ncbi:MULTISPECIES: hypothetical protein [unclassified Streptomyces]|uniref:hypothetical protein n=1 Tax=unclassified Streptomyces TaxID=2593676 RepID=UPI0001C18FA0|nr:hypothetical protein K373_00971 [Streptomyces sp. DvalAA-21]RAJ39487.1 hypothetical protein K351_01129 [Streptomyces sp. DpondAA-E10]RAJ53448.1 hypothetical protein K352_00525 [Streptomyces sp. DpondAA-A50]SCE30649.1 hypothetical protein GA0115235_1165137 [Streptomyces sp. DpondAA-F4a]SCM10627.1 hypothetical protein SAMN04883147_1077138 [Streptomyces sp. DpondAA-F4]
MKHNGVGYVTRFEVGSDFLVRHPLQQDDGRTIPELRVPAEEPDDLDAQSAGDIRVVHKSRRGVVDGFVRRSPARHAGRRGTVR